MLQYDRKAVGNHLRNEREKANLTQATVSKELGYSRFRGALALPSRRLFESTAQILELSKNGTLD